MVRLNIQDNATEFRVEIVGQFGGSKVEEVHYFWRTVLNEGERRFTVDISKMAGYDLAGCDLLRDMCRYGAKIAAATPESLVFLDEISGRNRRPELVSKGVSVLPVPLTTESLPGLKNHVSLLTEEREEVNSSDNGDNDVIDRGVPAVRLIEVIRQADKTRSTAQPRGGLTSVIAVRK